MDFIIAHPFVSGLCCGLIVALAAVIEGRLRSRGIHKELELLKKHLYTQMEINIKGAGAMKDELEDLRKQNENLRITVSSLKDKPGRPEIRVLHIYDKAVRLMNERAPGFAPAWESCIKEAEGEVIKTETGLLPFIKKVFRPSLMQPVATGYSAHIAERGDENGKSSGDGNIAGESYSGSKDKDNI